MTEPAWWELPAFFAIVSPLLLGPALINLVVARFFGRQAAITSLVVTYFVGLYLAGVLELEQCWGPGCSLERSTGRLLLELAETWAHTFIAQWFLHVPYILLGAAGAWAGLALRRRAARRRAETSQQAADPGPGGS